MTDAIALLDRSRAEMKRRIAELNKIHAKNAKELQKYLKEQVELGKKIMRDDVLLAVFECFENLVLRTPHETGRLRAGWQFTGDVSDINFVPPPDPEKYKEFTQDGSLGRAIQQSIRDSVFDETDALYVFNNVEYLLYLNAGWSKKQGGNFIDRFLQELKGELQKAASRQAA